jgi:hypothetical protein
VSGDQRRSWWRVALGGAGLAVAAFGVQQLLTGARAAAFGSAVAWLVGVLVVHDVVLAPAVVAVGVLLRRRLRGPARRALPVAAGGLLVAGVLCLVAAVAIIAPEVSGNPTVRPRDHGRGLAVLLVADLFGTLGVLAGGAVRSRLRRATTEATEKVGAGGAA